MYFEKMPHLDYDFPFLPNAEMQDIFRRVKFTENAESDSGNFETYIVKEGEKPEDIANTFYGHHRWWWLVLMSNNVIDMHTEWPKSVSEIDSMFSSYLNGNSYFVFEDLDVLPDDIIVKRDVTKTGGIDIDNYGHIDSYDRVLHKINVKRSKGTISEGDEIVVFRDVNGNQSYNFHVTSGFGATGCFYRTVGATSCTVFNGPDATGAPLCATAGATFAKVQKKTTIRQSAVRFEYQSDTISPYVSYINGPTGDFFSFQNMCGMTGTILYKYINSTAPSGIGVVTVGDDVVAINDRNRIIRLLSPSLIEKVNVEITALLRGDVPRGTTKIIEV